MRSLSIQVQPNRSVGIDIEQISTKFNRIAALTELVKHHAFDHGTDKGPYYNFTFGTSNPLELWKMIESELYQDQELARHMRAASMAMCSMEDGWHDYLLLYHFDPKVKLDDVNDL